MSEPMVDRDTVHEELERARTTFRALMDGASDADLRRPTSGTRWTNAQLLFHMLLGYLVVLRLLPLVRVFGHLPDACSRVFAGTLNAGTRPFHVVNYLGACGGALVFHHDRLTRTFERTVDSIHRHLDRESDDALRRRMHFPVGWDPFFEDRMSLLEVYHYGTQHFEFHRGQLTLEVPG